ncbi:hypothetical protein [Dictyobacter kobayashii]|uniref:Uncharacterized protein n=1 Tax=Dictyobacter kobayashii TaxID=2014872 RepID=A0A402ATH8_9CHLR|nr:hypothetical protein [Dictyobacter kobayashii]GCE22343.1 hypothetical protein KDK_61430 [Dictyobacter kobayashii]
MVVADFYTNGEYLQKNPGWHIDAAQWKADSVLQMIKRNALSPHTICDIGCAGLARFYVSCNTNCQQKARLWAMTLPAGNCAGQTT